MINFIKSREKQIENLYIKILERPADKDGLEYYKNCQLSINEIKENMEKSDEYCQIAQKKYYKNFPLINVSKTRLNHWIHGTQKFYSIDSKESFLENKKILGDNWIWADDSKIEYTFNSHGYRMKEFDKINWENYVATFGCSLVVGHGIPEKETYAYRISKDLNCDLVNAAVCGGSNDLIVKNVIRALSFPVKPKIMIVSWTNFLRKSFWQNGECILYLVHKKNGDSWEKSYHNYIENIKYLDYYFMEQRYTVQTLCKMNNIPLWEFTSFNEYNEKIIPDLEKIYFPFESPHHPSIEYINKMYARDINWQANFVTAHPGLDYQDTVFNRWLKVKEEKGIK